MAFLLLFFYLFLATAYQASGAQTGRVDFFFNMDPLLLVTVWLGGHAAAAAMLLALVTVVVTVIFGRWFCGWFCPFGALHNFFTSLRGGTKKEKLAAGGYSRWHAVSPPCSSASRSAAGPGLDRRTAGRLRLSRLDRRSPPAPADALAYAHVAAVAAVALGFALITYFHVVVGELVPKSLALRRAEALAVAVAPPMLIFMTLARPAVRLLKARPRSSCAALTFP